MAKKLDSTELSKKEMEEGTQRKKSYDIGFKLKVVTAVKEGMSKVKAAKTYGINRRRVQEWVQQEEQLKKMARSRRRLPGAGCKIRYQDIEEKLIAYFEERRNKGVRVTGKAFKSEALRLHKAYGNQSFKASSSWYRRFKKRHNISLRRATHISQHSQEIISGKVDRFLQLVIKHRRNRQYGLHYIGNMDETPVWLEMPGTSTLEYSGGKEVSVSSAGQQKKRFTVVLGALADGSKLPVFALLPGVRPPAKQMIPAGVIIHMCGTGKSWSNEQITQVWLNRIWGRNNTERRLLVWDTFRGHTTNNIKSLVRNEFNTDMIYIPGGCTSKLQPADVSWNKPFKNNLQEMYDEWLFSGEKTFTPKGNMRAPSLDLFLKWIKKAWDSITPEIIRKSFKKTGISNNLDGTEDEMFDESDDDDEEPFDGFTAAEVEDAEDYSSNMASAINGACLSEDSDSGPEMADSDDDVDNYENPDSPGH